jgi:hypothetical protein
MAMLPKALSCNAHFKGSVPNTHAGCADRSHHKSASDGMRLPFAGAWADVWLDRGRAWRVFQNASDATPSMKAHIQPAGRNGHAG